MPKLSLYRPVKSNDYNYLDKIVAQQLTVGGTDLYIHKYLGPNANTPSIDYTQPQYDKLSPINIQDLFFLENRDRVYDTDIIRLRGHYNVQNLDFDLSQFGLFLNNDIIFITVHYNTMIDLVGRKLMVGDVIELPHLIDYNPLNDSIKTALKRFYQITDGNYASEGFSQTWFPHLWRIKCEPLVDSQEFSQILQEPTDKDNYLGLWDKDKTYPPGYVITYGDKNYISIAEVPAGIYPPNPTYWQLDTNQDLKDILSTYNKNIQINNAIIEEAKRQVPLSGYDNNNLYIVPTYGIDQPRKLNQPAPPINVITPQGPPNPGVGVVTFMRDPKYKNPSVAIKVSKESLKNIWDMTADTDITQLMVHSTAELETVEYAPEIIGNGSGSVETTKALAVFSLGPVTGPYGTADNTYATADQDPTAPGFTGEITPDMDYRADCVPGFQYIARSSPRSFGYTYGYLTGDAVPPNGYKIEDTSTNAGIAFPLNPKVGDYFLRIDYFPQILYRWDGFRWVRISSNVRTGLGYTDEDQSQKSLFINNSYQTKLTDGTFIPQKQALSTILRPKPDPIPPVL